MSRASPDLFTRRSDSVEMLNADAIPGWGGGRGEFFIPVKNPDSRRRRNDKARRWDVIIVVGAINGPRLSQIIAPLARVAISGVYSNVLIDRRSHDRRLSGLRARRAIRR